MSTKHECIVCGWHYDESLGEPTQGVQPGVTFDSLPAGFICPECGVDKHDFIEVQ